MKFTDQEFAKLKDLLLIFQWGQQSLLTKLHIMQEDFKNFHENNPMEYVKGRIKTPSSIAGKLHKMGVPLTAENALKHLKDIAGVRIICPFSKDIATLVALLHAMPDVTVLEEKDYVTHPKPSGYRSYHVILQIPVFHSGVPLAHRHPEAAHPGMQAENVTIEVQIRTEAMNFWSTLEHRVRYKYQEHIPAHLCDELVICADKIAELDDRMFLIHEIISLINA